MAERLPAERKLVDAIIGANIRQVRRNAELTLDKLAKAIGISLQQLQKYETGANRVSASMLIQVSTALNVQVTKLLPNVEEGVGVVGVRSQERAKLHSLIFDILDDLDYVDLQSLWDSAKSMRGDTEDS